MEVPLPPADVELLNHKDLNGAKRLNVLNHWNSWNDWDRLKNDWNGLGSESLNVERRFEGRYTGRPLAAGLPGPLHIVPQAIFRDY